MITAQETLAIHEIELSVHRFKKCWVCQLFTNLIFLTCESAKQTVNFLSFEHGVAREQTMWDVAL
jgi:hypothetical protein